MMHYFLRMHKVALLNSTCVGYALPKQETVRNGFIGLGNRGPGAVKRLNKIDGVDIRALCDIRPEKANVGKKSLESSGHHPEVNSR